MMSFQKPNVFIIYKNEDVNTLLAGIFWLKGFEPFKFIDGNESLKRFREIDGKVDAVVTSYEIALDNDLMLIVNIKRINPNTKVLVIASEEEEESKRTSMYEYGADEIVLIPLSPTDISDKILLMVSKRNLLENPTNDLV
jgi:DNA-binding response OmpR family regulator